jgi:hypothetical protein
VFGLCAVLAGVLLLGTCDTFINPELKGLLSLEPPLPGIPVGRIVREDGRGNLIEPVPGETFGNYQFRLEWKDPELEDGEEFVLETPEHLRALDDVFSRWLNYESYVEPLPFIPPATGTGQLKIMNIWVDDTNWKLKNAAAEGQLVILRYWNSAWEPLTTSSWTAHHDDRVAAFEEAKGKIESMMADIEASPFYEVSQFVGNRDRVFLKELYNLMKKFILVPDTDLYKVYGTWTIADHTGSHTTKLHSGQLYELYFGHIPKRGEYKYPDEPLVWPDP